VWHDQFLTPFFFSRIYSR